MTKNATRRPTTRGARHQASVARWWQSPFTWVVALIVIAGVVTAIVTTATGGTHAVTTPQTSPAEVIGSPLPEFTAQDPAIGMAAPTLEAQDPDGRLVRIGNDGVARLVGFFAHWCPQCRSELPVVADWLNDNELPDGVEVVAVATAVDPTAVNYPPTEWFEREDWPSTIVLDDEDQSLASGVGLTAFPFWVAIDADGNVVRRVPGSLSEDDLERLIDGLASTS